ncbi:glycosyltransferase [Brevibacillus centrosporus]|uniref:glycosyltransferase n=1 Tax=Brevibacillus centrosporus TaxID=54910 RepID=UPI000F09AF2F|nr:glycosyltransferase [Brevibacillus centrosporus]MEC2127681.1 glycosyltransferase [Brevibacillus centrosporus]RNB66933.1 glycosyltransferase [Brevibacillus centrosporus]GED30794.1 glucosyltransferase [Brevibacillus centrosporus]
MHRVLVYRRKFLPRSETFIYEQLVGHNQVKPVVLTRQRPFNRKQFPYSPVYVRKHMAGLSTWLRKHKIKCLHARFGPAGLELLPYARKTRLPLITSFHGFDATKRVKGNPGYRRALRKLFRRGKAFTVVSGHMKKRLIRLGCPAKKITMIRSGIDLRKFPMQAPRAVANEEFRLLSVGRLTEKKGMDTLVKAFASVRKKHPRAKLIIVGEGEEKRKLRRLIKKYKLGKQVVLKGALPHQEVQHELAKCHLFIIACKTARNGDQEGIPNVLMEAMATGRPVVSTYHSGIPELIEHKVTGYLVPERSPSKLGRMINQVLDARAEWGEVVARAREKVERNHNIEKQRAKLEDLYLRVMKK